MPPPQRPTRPSQGPLAKPPAATFVPACYQQGWPSSALVIGVQQQLRTRLKASKASQPHSPPPGAAASYKEEHWLSTGPAPF